MNYNLNRLYLYLNLICIIFTNLKIKIITYFLIFSFLFSCDLAYIDRANKDLVIESNFKNISSTEKNTPKLEDSVIIHIGTFLGNEKRNYSGNFQSDSLNELWKTNLGSGITIVSSSKGKEIWRGAGWTGQPLIIQEKEELFIIQGSFDHGLKKICAKTGEIIWSYPYDDIIKGTGTIYINDTASDPNHRVLILQGSRLGNNNNLSSKEVWSYRAISYFTGEEVWRMNIERGKSYSRDVDASALIINDTAYLGLENGSFVVFDPSNKEKIVKKDKVYQTPVIHKKILLYDKKDIKTHRGNLVTEASPCRIGNRVYVASGSGHVFGYNIVKQKIDWDFYIGSDLDGTTIVTQDSCLLVPVEKQYIKGKGGVFKLNPRKPDTACVEWFFPTKDKSFSSWKGGVIGSPAVNEQYKASFQEFNYAAFTGIDGNLYVVELSKLSGDTVEGPNKKKYYPKPKLVFKKYIGASISTPVFSKGRLMAAGYKGIYVFKYIEGEFIQTDYRKGNFEATPSVHNGRVYIASRNGYFYCFGKTDTDTTLLASTDIVKKERDVKVKYDNELLSHATLEEKNVIEVESRIKPENKEIKKKIEVKKENKALAGTTEKKISKKNNNYVTAYIIVGSFDSEKNAKRLIDKLRNNGFDGAESPGQSKNGYYRVSIASFESINTAKKQLKEFSKEYPYVWVLEK